MHYTYFEIENFRGIQKTRLDLESIPNSHIYTLVGLNESGKTTILEAINHFTYKNESLDPLDLPGYAIKDNNTLIPIGHRSNFNGTVCVKFGLSINDSDEDRIAAFALKETGYKLVEKIKEITVKRIISFKNSKLDNPARKNTWYISLKGQKGRSKKITQIKATEDAWQKIVNYIMSTMPSVLYFPNFLFEFPDKIYLDEANKDSQKHEFYKLVIQDILDSLNNNLDLKTHILDRAKSNDTNDKRNLDMLLLEMARNVTNTVFDAWNKIFNQQILHKKIIIRCDKDENDQVYLMFLLEDTDGYFKISERSLGFRWFFVFLLLTQYRGFRKNSPNNVLFLFDEPASNLHPSAQAQLLDSFDKLSKKCRIIYTTHSHHLINPEWLESAFVVKNDGLQYDHNELNYNANKTDINVTRYREFAVKHPNQTDYYRPILDVLDYAPSKLEYAPTVVMAEGKNDYYALNYIQLLNKSQKEKLNILPGTSSGNLEPVIRLYIAWGRQFIILLDSDEEGIKQKNRYQNLFETTLSNRVFTLSDIKESWKNHEMESLFTDEDKIAIQRLNYPNDSRFHKKNFNRSLQELIIKKTKLQLSENTLENFSLVFSFLKDKLKTNEENITP